MFELCKNYLRGTYMYRKHELLDVTLQPLEIQGPVVRHLKPLF